VSQTVSSIPIRATGINPLDIIVTLRDASVDRKPLSGQNCTFDSSRGIQLTSQGENLFYCNNFGVLPVGEFYASITTYGAVDIFRVGRVEAAAIVLSNPTYKRAANAQNIEIQGSNFYPSPNHTQNIVNIAGNIPCDVTTSTLTQINCKPAQILPVGDLYVRIELFFSFLLFSFLLFSSILFSSTLDLLLF